jgi:hypothetical protein
MFLLRLVPAVQGDESEANDPIPEEEAIFVRLVSLIARPRLKRVRPVRASMIALVVSGIPALFENRWM